MHIDDRKSRPVYVQPVNRDYYLRLYKPHPNDWYGTTKQYLYRIRDGWRKVELMRRKYREIMNQKCDDDRDKDTMDSMLSPDELHKKLDKAEQDMERVTAEVMSVLDILHDPDQRSVMVGRYIYNETWKNTAERMGMEITNVQKLHQSALPILKRNLSEDGVIDHSAWHPKRKNQHNRSPAPKGAYFNCADCVKSEKRRFS